MKYVIVLLEKKDYELLQKKILEEKKIQPLMLKLLIKNDLAENLNILFTPCIFFIRIGLLFSNPKVFDNKIISA